MLQVALAAGLCTAVAGGAVAQEPAVASHALYVEAFGNALIWGSINYERLVTPRWAVRVGVSPSRAFPLMLNHLVGTGSHRLETGVGVLAGGGVYGTATLGYRYQPPAGGLVFRSGFTPVLGSEGVAPWFGVSLGVAYP
jgi:hypothetical protein